MSTNGTSWTRQETILLEGKEYSFTAPLTLTQLRECKVGVSLEGENTPEGMAKLNFERNCAVLLAAVQAENPDLTYDKLLTMRITNDELRDAVIRILDISGLVKIEEKKDGEKKDGSTGEAAAGERAA